MESDVNIEKSSYAALVYVLFIAPLFVRDDEFAELRAPVSEVIYADDLIAERAVYPAQRAADNGIEKVSHMERFGDIDGRKVDAYRLSRPYLRSAVVFAFRQYLFDDRRCDHLLVKRKVDVSADGFSLFEEIVRADAGNYLLREYHRAFFHFFSEFETRQTEISHRGIFGNRDERLYLRAFHVLKNNYIRKQFFVIH